MDDSESIVFEYRNETMNLKGPVELLHKLTLLQMYSVAVGEKSTVRNI